ncbi:MAG: bifunctional phosphopantothenoylcysteine decarboxylase/phosphopantothenate--cysteine ligase CoaBC [Pseudomonadales bacterium]
MYELSNRNVLLGVTGGIAAYKAAELLRRLQDQNANVRVVMTPAATEFITPLTMQALSGEPVHLDLLNPEAEAAMGHIELARWADALLVAPASADFIARIVHGQADDLLSTLYLACSAPKFIAPAMNQGMWAQTSTQNNIEALHKDGVSLLGPDSGIQACGDVGAGRLLDIDQIVSQVSAHFSTGALAGLDVVVTAGPTQEAIDPVRFLSNHSSGKMGFALARAASEAGAKVTLIAGPVTLSCSENIQRVNVKSAKEMLAATLEHMAGCDIFIATAAVADYTPLNVANNKIKKNSSEMELKLTRTEDILATVSALSTRPFCVGFAAETDQVISYARGKLERKNLDLIVANDVSNAEIGFQSDQNKVTLVSKEQELDLPQMSKLSLAAALVEEIGKRYKNT